MLKGKFFTNPNKINYYYYGYKSWRNILLEYCEMSLSKEQAQLLLPFLQKLTAACCNVNEEGLPETKPEGTGQTLDLEQLAALPTESATRNERVSRNEFSSDKLFAVKKKNSKSSSAHNYCHVRPTLQLYL